MQSLINYDYTFESVKSPYLDSIKHKDSDEEIGLSSDGGSSDSDELQSLQEEEPEGGQGSKCVKINLGVITDDNYHRSFSDAEDDDDELESVHIENMEGDSCENSSEEDDQVPGLTGNTPIAVSSGTGKSLSSASNSRS